MDTFKLLKLKSYFTHLVAGTLAVLFGAGIFQAILLEMLKEYDAASKAAYICGLIASGTIVLYGVYELFKAFNYERRILKTLEPGERREFISELSGDIQMSIPGQVVMTRHYLLVPINGGGSVRVLAKNKMVGCFQAYTHREEAATEVQMVIYDMDFKMVKVDIRGKGSSEAAAKLYEKICADMPWIFHEDYDSFLDQSRKSGYRKKLIKQMRDARMRYESGYNSELEAEEELEAMSQDVRERLNPESLLKRFSSKKSK